MTEVTRTKEEQLAYRKKYNIKILFDIEYKKQPTDDELLILQKTKNVFVVEEISCSDSKVYGFKPKIQKDWDNRNKTLIIKQGICPCGVCNHNVMEGCNVLDCQCCSELCT